MEDEFKSVEVTDSELEEELEETQHFFDIETGVKDIIEKFQITEKQAFFCWFVALGRTPLQAARMSYKYGDDRNSRTMSGKLMNMWKIKDVLEYLNKDQHLERTMHDMKLTLLNWGREKLSKKEYHAAAAVGIWKTLMALAYEDKLPDSGKSLEKSLESLGKAYAISEAAKERGMDAYKKPVEEDDDSDPKSIN